jgi:hypothetical protein
MPSHQCIHQHPINAHISSQEYPASSCIKLTLPSLEVEKLVLVSNPGNVRPTANTDITQNAVGHSPCGCTEQFAVALEESREHVVGQEVWAEFGVVRRSRGEIH